MPLLSSPSSSANDLPPMTLAKHTCVINLKTGYSLRFKSFVALKQSDSDKILSFIKVAEKKPDAIKTVSDGKQSTEIDTSYLAIKYGITEMEIVNTNDLYFPPIGLKFLAPQYDILKENKSISDIRELVKIMNKGKKISLEKERDPFFYIVLMAEFIKSLEERDKVSPKELDILKEHVTSLTTICNQEVPDKIIPLHEIATVCGIGFEYTDQSKRKYSFTGKKDKVAFFDLSKKLLEEHLGLYDVFSIEFAENLKQCLVSIAGGHTTFVEIAAGKGMLSASLEKAGKKPFLTSDEAKVKEPWCGIKVYKHQTVPLIEKYIGKYRRVIYLAAQADVGMIIKLILSGKPIILMQTGFAYPVQLKQYCDSTQLQVINLNIQGYSGACVKDEVRLLAINFSAEDYTWLLGKVPAKYLR